MSLSLNVEKVIKGDRDSLLDALRNIGNTDSDLNGENGKEYRWEEAEDYETNLDFLIARVEDIEDDEECVTEFFDYWMREDGNYYIDYELGFVKDEDDVIGIAFATTTEW